MLRYNKDRLLDYLLHYRLTESHAMIPQEISPFAFSHSDFFTKGVGLLPFVFLGKPITVN